MKKAIFIMMLAAITLSMSAQKKYWDSSRPDHRFGYSVQAGLNFNKQYTMEDEGADHAFSTGFHAGIGVDVNIIRSFSVTTGVYYFQKGWKDSYSDYRGYYDTKDNAAYVQLPLLASYRVALSDAVRFQIDLGPYFAFGISGKTKTDYNFGEPIHKEYDSFDEYEGMKKFDCGIHLGASVNYSHLLAGVFYERGLKNISRIQGEKFQNGTVGVSLGYKF